MLCGDLEIGDVIELVWYYRSQYIGRPLEIINIFNSVFEEFIDVALKPINCPLPIIEISLTKNNIVGKHYITILSLIEET